MDPAKPIWRNNGLLAVLILFAGIAALAVSMYSPAPEVTVNYDYTYDEDRDRTEMIVRMWSETDRTLVIDRQGFSLGDHRMTASGGAVYLSPYGYAQIILHCDGDASGGGFAYKHSVPMAVHRFDYYSQFA